MMLDVVPMLGPLVIAGISIDKKNIKKLSKLGVKDSKKLTPKLREYFYKKIIEIVDDYYIAKISPRLIDASVKKTLSKWFRGKIYGKSCFKIKSRCFIC